MVGGRYDTASNVWGLYVSQKRIRRISPSPREGRAGGGSRTTAVELRSADFSPPPLGTFKSAGSGMNSALQVRRNWLNSTAVGAGRGATATGNDTSWYKRKAG